MPGFDRTGPRGQGPGTGGGRGNCPPTPDEVATLRGVGRGGAPWGGGRGNCWGGRSGRNGRRGAWFAGRGRWAENWDRTPVQAPDQEAPGAKD